MKQIFINLKRFDVKKPLGGICTIDNPEKWIEWIMDECVKNELGKLDNMEVTFFLPEGLVIPAVKKLRSFLEEDTKTINVGCQGVFREDVQPGANFGAFTTNCPAAAVKNFGCTWSIIGHSEERKDKIGIITAYDSEVLKIQEKRINAKRVVDALINKEVLCALKQDIKVLLCVGETAEEKGEGNFEVQKSGIRKVLKTQLDLGLDGVKSYTPQNNIVIGYEPIWAIGPGKIPPAREYISFISRYIKEYTKGEFGFDPVVVYGGGLKEENAGMISSVDTIGGGLVALTRFTGEIGFYPDELKKIIEEYLKKG